MSELKRTVGDDFEDLARRAVDALRGDAWAWASVEMPPDVCAYAEVVITCPPGERARIEAWVAKWPEAARAMTRIEESAP